MATIMAHPHRASLKPRGAFLLVGLLIGAVAANAPASAGGNSPVVVELFTSQGCSSCPPADEYLGELASRRDIIPLAFHVDYWNYIGWIDPYASKEMTQRQKDYVHTLNQRYVYTPEMVVNGAAHEVGSDRHGVEKLIAEAKKAPAGPLVSLTRGREGSLRVMVGGGPADHATVWLVKFDREHTTSVKRGENEGQALTEFQVVRTLRDVATWNGAPLDIVLDPAKTEGPGNGGVAILLQRDGNGPIISAAMLKSAAAS